MTSDTTLTVEGVVREVVTVRRPAPIALFFSVLAETLSVIPTAPDTVAGRKRAKTIKGILLGVGLLIILAGYKSAWGIGAGVFVMLFALIAPLPEVWKKDQIRALKKRMFTVEHLSHPVTLKYDGRRLMLERDGEQLRRVLTNRKFAMRLREHAGGHVWCGVSPHKSKKKRDAIWMAIEHAEDELSGLPVGPSFSSSQADHPVVLDARDAHVKVLLNRVKDAFILAK